MPSYYEINVALDGQHFFATAPRSTQNENQARELVKSFRRRFPESEGFQITCTFWKSEGYAQKF